MYSALGVSATRNRNNTLTVKVRLIDDRTGQPLETKEFTAPTLPQVQALVQQHLESRVAAATDAALQAAVVNQVLAQI